MDRAELLKHKRASTKAQVHELIQKRWSPRAFADKTVPDSEIQALFEAASWAASSFNEQPWRYFYAHRSEESGFQRLLSCINEGNQQWAKDAAVLLLSLAKNDFSRNEQPNRHAWHDTGAANTTLLLEAVSRDIYGHAMAGFDRGKTIAEFDIADSLEPVCFIALGYLGQPDQLEEPLRSREAKVRSRKPVDAFTFKIQ